MRLRFLVARVRGLFSQSRVEDRLDEELRAHLEMLVEENFRRGMAPDEARYAALRSLGGVESMKESYRDQQRLAVVDTLFHDLRYAARMLVHRPAFAALVVVTLGLGIGASTATFSIVDAVLLRPLPYRQPDQLVAVWGALVRHVGTTKNFDSYPEFQEWQRSNHTFERLEAITWALAGQTLSWRGKPQRVLAIPATEGFFSLLGVHAAQGRTFQHEDLAGCAVVLSHRFWKNQLGAPVGIVGGNLTLDGKACTVVGVMGSDFDFYPRQSDLWTLITPETDNLLNPYDYIVGVFGSLT